ncbi:hypothetical protein BDR05DRAFT_949550 [Suillus weaverae]|nr:hypothetical protein BDR05DRAFT_949550 [Suillus weaverae]
MRDAELIPQQQEGDHISREHFSILDIEGQVPDFDKGLNKPNKNVDASAYDVIFSNSISEILHIVKSDPSNILLGYHRVQGEFTHAMICYKTEFASLIWNCMDRHAAHSRQKLRSKELVKEHPKWWGKTWHCRNTENIWIKRRVWKRLRGFGLQGCSTNLSQILSPDHPSPKVLSICNRIISIPLPLDIPIIYDLLNACCRCGTSDQSMVDMSHTPRFQLWHGSLHARSECDNFFPTPVPLVPPLSPEEDAKSSEFGDGIEVEIFLTFDFKLAGFIEVNNVGVKTVVDINEESSKHNKGEHLNPQVRCDTSVSAGIGKFQIPFREFGFA